MQPTIFITGIGKRIGYYLAQAFIERGYRVIGTYRSHYPSIDALKAAGADLYACDFNDEHQIDDLIHHLTQHYRSIDAIIHNASDWLADDDPMGSQQIMQRMMQVHVHAPYRLNLGLADLLHCAQGQADIIHLTDYVAQRGSQKHIAYAASKAALENMTLSFAAKLAPKVKVNSIAPALISFNQHDTEAYKQKALAKSLLQKEAGEIEVLRAVDYLMQNHYMTGRSLALDGGRHLK